MKFYIKTDKFFPHQRDWWNLPNKIKLLVGGYGCGKTYIGSLRAIYLSFVNSGLPGMYVSPTHQMAFKTVIPTIREICTRSQIDYTFNQQRKEFLIDNWDGIIWLGSGDDPDSLRGPNLAWAGIDEPFIQKKEVLDQMLARVRVGKSREIFMTGTPEELNWGYDLAMNDAGGYDVGMIRGRTKDNTAITPDYYATLYSAYTPEMREAYLNGEFVNLKQGRVYRFDRSIHLTERGELNLEVCAGIDFNVDYMSAEVFYLGNGWIHFFDEIRLANSNSFELADKLKDKYPGIRIFPDATGAYRKSSSSKSDHAIFEDAGFRVYARPKNPDVKDRVNAVNKLFMQDAITVEPGRCEWLLKDFERVVWSSGDLDKRSDPALTHSSDAAGYAIHYLFPVVERTAWTIKRV